jgi:hypothetical protein
VKGLSSIWNAADGQRLGVGTIVCLGLAIVIWHVAVIAAPGFFSHDEWQRFDDVAEHGLGDYVSRHAHIRAGHDFGTPIRPIGFLEEGFSSLWMETLPFVPHLIDVLLHTGIVILLLPALRMARLDARASGLAALLFGVSPLTTMATGWVGASFDLWYTLFILAGCVVALNICKNDPSPLRLTLLAATTVGAVLSKETAIVMPGVVILAAIGYFLAVRRKVGWRQIATIAATSTVMISAYLWIRLPALRESFSGAEVTAYTPGTSNVLLNVAGYLAYPFLVGISEMANFAIVPPLTVIAALAAHALIPLAIAWRFGLAAGFLYIAAYLIFLIPVLPLPGGGSHYLYASAIPMGIAIGSLIHSEWTRRNRLSLGAVSVLVALLIVHSWRNELFIYNTALCQTRFLESLNTRLAIEAARETHLLIVRPDSGAPAHVGLRAVHGRARYSGAHGLKVVFDLDRVMPLGDKSVAITMTSQCRVR